MRLLLIEDNDRLRESIGEYFKDAGYIIDTASNGEEGLWAATETPYDAILLDLNLPKVDGMDILRKLRAMRNPVHILVISARDQLEDRLQALDAGADDYLVKPFSLSESLARVRALLRRNYAQKSPILEVADLSLDPLRREVRRAGRLIELTSLEYRLLEYLMHRANQVVSRTDIWERVFEDGSGGTSNTVDVYIGYLRRKLTAQNEPNLIVTKRGHGYLLQQPSP